MNATSKTGSIPLLLMITISVSALGAALFCQHVLGWQPCPLCVIQRVAFIGVTLSCLMALLFSSSRLNNFFKGLGLTFSVMGAAVASYHWWILKHPGQSCGIDPIETLINSFKITDLAPWMFKADGLCTTPYPPILGLDLPVWSLILLVFNSLAALSVFPLFQRLMSRN